MPIKRKPGRPRTGRTPFRNVALPADMYSDLARLALRNARPVAAEIRLAVAAHLKRKQNS